MKIENLENMKKEMIKLRNFKVKYKIRMLNYLVMI